MFNGERAGEIDELFLVCGKALEDVVGKKRAKYFLYVRAKHKRERRQVDLSSGVDRAQFYSWEICEFDRFLGRRIVGRRSKKYSSKNSSH